MLLYQIVSTLILRRFSSIFWGALNEIRNRFCSRSVDPSDRLRQCSGQNDRPTDLLHQLPGSSLLRDGRQPPFKPERPQWSPGQGNRHRQMPLGRPIRTSLRIDHSLHVRDDCPPYTGGQTRDGTREVPTRKHSLRPKHPSLLVHNTTDVKTPYAYSKRGFFYIWINVLVRIIFWAWLRALRRSHCSKSFRLGHESRTYTLWLEDWVPPW